MKRLFSQLEQVDNATPLARSEDGNIYEGISLGLKHWNHACTCRMAWPTRRDPRSAKAVK